tara:strand:+ start:1152 stop:1415 length:264 start_codon:yes stop_codon:yes gene_type:complete
MDKDYKEIIEEEWLEMCNKKISMRDIMMIALIDDILPDSAYQDAAEYILEMLLSRYHDISIESIDKLLDGYREYWDRIFLQMPHLMQ